MINKFFETFCKTIVTHFKIPRKGVSVILFLFMSLIIFLLNKFTSLQTIIPNGSIFSQLLYAIWLYSIITPIIKTYNEYCDQKDAEKAKQGKQQKSQEQISFYMEAFALCDWEEEKLLTSFYYQQTTSIRVENVAVVRAMKNKGIDIFSYEDSYFDSRKALTSTTGLKIINKYFDRQKPQFFELLKKLDEKELKLIKQFVEFDDEQLSLYKKEIKIAKSIINKFKETQFDNIYIDTEGFLTIPTLYLAYLKQYFSEGLE